MRLYEIVYIFDATLEEDAVNKKLEQYQPLVAGSDGEVTAVDHWGIRQMAYPVQKKKTAYYVVAHVRAASEGLPEFERALKLDEDVMRYLIVLNEGEPTSGKSIFGERPLAVASRDRNDEVEETEPVAAPVETEGKEDGEEGEPALPRHSPPEFSGGRGRRRRMEGPPIELLNYKDVTTLSQFMTEQGKILPKRTTKVTSRFQRPSAAPSNAPATLHWCPTSGTTRPRRDSSRYSWKRRPSPGGPGPVQPDSLGLPWYCPWSVSEPWLRYRSLLCPWRSVRAGFP